MYVYDFNIKLASIFVKKSHYLKLWLLDLPLPVFSGPFLNRTELRDPRS